jgi:hypothetical protein
MVGCGRSLEDLLEKSRSLIWIRKILDIGGSKSLVVVIYGFEMEGIHAIGVEGSCV